MILTAKTGVHGLGLPKAKFAFKGKKKKTPTKNTEYCDGNATLLRKNNSGRGNRSIKDNVGAASEFQTKKIGCR